MDNRNVVIFSSGVSEQNGLLGEIKALLQQMGYNCFDWRGLFANAKDTSNIALLPMLIKKIPTFDFAVLICEGHDATYITRGEDVTYTKTMRDNVLFEIGLCAMALGLNRTILVTDAEVRLPDDLRGTNNTLAVRQVCIPAEFCTKTEKDKLQSVADICSEIDLYIKSVGDQLNQVVIGAAASGACGYVSNFICRTLEHIDGEIIISKDGESQAVKVPLDKVYMHIILPFNVDDSVGNNIRTESDEYLQGTVLSARNRPAEFLCCFNGEELHIVDYPTNIVTSYDTAKIILDMDADDTYDETATSRFISKELNLYESTLRTLMNSDYIHKVICQHYPDASEDERRAMEHNVTDVIKNRLTITRK